jgi:formate-dependent nitrite reductase cytochrome c552 subunit
VTRPALAVLLAGLLGIPIGVGAFTFVYAKCFSYLSTHPRARVNCHVMNPHGIKAFKAKQGVADFDPNRDATRQEMRAYVCGQCHVEYYFKGPGKIVT